MAYVDCPINSHLDRLKYDEFREKPSLFGDVWLPGLMGLFGGLTVPMMNVVVHKPYATGIWRLAIIVPAAVGAGLWLRDNNREKSRVKWAKIRHYIELHPEDFPPYPPRLKVGDTLAPWFPRRSGW